MSRIPDSPDPAALPETTLAAEQDFVRRLVRSLIRDPNDAEDLAQEAWLRARGQRAQDRPGLLGAIARNLARNLRRDRRRRQRHEADAGRAEAAPPTEEILAFEARRRMVVEAVLALPEPYQSTIVAVYFEDRRPRDIAKGAGIAAATVRARLHRAHRLLRDHLRRTHEERGESWLRALVPLVGLRGPGSLLFGSVLMNKSPTILIVVAALVVTVPVAWAVLGASGLGRSNPDDLGALYAETDRPPSSPQSVPRRSRIAEGGPRSTAARPDLAAGRLRYADGTPAAGLPYWTEASADLFERRRRQPAQISEQTLRTDTQGGFHWNPAHQLVWFRLDPAHDLALPLEQGDRGGEVRLPPRSALEISFTGVSEGMQLRCEYDPAWSEPDGEEEHGVTMATMSWSTGRRLCFHRRRAVLTTQVGAGRREQLLRLPGFQGLLYRLRPAVAGAHLHEGAVYLRAPGRIQRDVAGIYPSCRLELVERDGRLSQEPAFLITGLEGEKPHLRRARRFVGAIPELYLDWQRHGQNPQLQVVTADGESFEQILAPGEKDLRPLRFVRGKGKPALRLRLPPGDWSRVFLWQRPQLQVIEPLRPGLEYLSGGQFRLATADGHILVPGGGGSWRQAYAVDPQGRVAVATAGRVAEGFRLLPVFQKLPPLTLARYARRHPESPVFQLGFQVQAPGSSDAPWLPVRWANWSAEVRDENPVWQLIETRGLAYRFLLREPRRPARLVDPWQ